MILLAPGMEDTLTGVRMDVEGEMAIEMGATWMRGIEIRAGLMRGTGGSAEEDVSEDGRVSSSTSRTFTYTTIRHTLDGTALLTHVWMPLALASPFSSSCVTGACMASGRVGQWR